MININNLKKCVYCFLIVILFSSCSKYNLQNEISINYDGYSIYLKPNKNTDAILPPIYNLRFSVQNLTKDDKIFVSKGNEFDKIKSQMYLLDTLNNKIIKIFSNDIEFIKSNQKIKITGDVDIRKNKEYFELSDDFFNKLDYNSDKTKFEKKFNDMISRSIIVYIQDTTDISSFKLQNENVTPLKLDNIIKINKN